MIYKQHWYEPLLQCLGLMSVDRHNYEVSVVKGKIAESYDSYIKEAYAERDELIEENERVAGLIQGIRGELIWKEKALRRANDTMYEVRVELNDDHPATAKKILDEYFYDEDDFDFDDGGDDDALCSETAPDDSGGVPQEP